jgi:hypothetical protein
VISTLTVIAPRVYDPADRAVVDSFSRKRFGAAMETIPSSILKAEITGRNLMPGTFGEQFKDRQVLLVFLRHFG